MDHGLGVNSVMLLFLGMRAAWNDRQQTSAYRRMLTTALAGWLLMFVLFLNTLALSMLPLTLWALRLMKRWLNPPRRPTEAVVAAPRSSARPTVGAEGDVTTLAGGPTPGFVDGAPLRARFHSPRAITRAPDGALLVIDTEVGAVVKMTWYRPRFDCLPRPLRHVTDVHDGEPPRTARRR
jgi:hypothetical protein